MLGKELGKEFNKELIIAEVEKIYPEIVEIRRHLHMYPELSQHEDATSDFICSKLEELGVEFTRCKNDKGIVGIIYGKDKAHAVGIRADMDALPVTEAVDTPFCSKVEGVMHACGHDIHTAILIGTAAVLKKYEAKLPVSVKLFFQAAEETIGGADSMIKEGCMKNPEVTNVLGLHVSPFTDTGCVELVDGPMNAATCEFNITVKGKGCHGAHPNVGVDPLIPACSIVTGLQSIITRAIDPTENVLITVGSFHCGTKGNIISSEAHMNGTIRTLSLEMRSFVKERLARLANNVCNAHGAACDVVFGEGYPPLINDSDVMHKMKDAFSNILNSDSVKVSKHISMGADDFAFFCQTCPSFYYDIGCRKPEDKDPAALHSEFFDPDEACIKTGILTQIAGVFALCKNN